MAKPHPMAFRREAPCPKCGCLWSRPMVVLNLLAHTLPIVSGCADCKYHDESEDAK